MTIILEFKKKKISPFVFKIVLPSKHGDNAIYKERKTGDKTARRDQLPNK